MKELLGSIVILLTVCAPIYSQDGIKLSGQSLPYLEQVLILSPKESIFGTMNFPLLKKTTISEKNRESQNTISQAMPLVYAYKDLALFCKLEVQLEKVAKLPIKFRLGSVDYVDWLEGKRDRY